MPLALGIGLGVGQGGAPLSMTQRIIQSSPIAYWPLAEASGTVIVDESGNGRDGVYKAAGEPLLGQTGIGDGRTAPLFDGTNDFGNVFTASLQSAFNNQELTLAVWLQVANAGVWADATTRRALYLEADANNRVALTKTGTANQLNVFYTAGATNKSVSFVTGGQTSWFHLAVTVSKGADQLKMYINGTQQGSTQTALGVWAGSLGATTCCVGAASTAGANPWSGLLAHAAVWARALSAAEVLSLATL